MSAFGGNFRSSAGDLGLVDDPPRRTPERWDRDKFERFSRHGRLEDRESFSRRGPEERNTFRFEEHDRFGGRDRRNIEIEEKVDRRGPRGRVEERERFFEEDRFDHPRRRPDSLDEPAVSELADRALAPYRRKSIVERDLEPVVRRPARPQYIRRHSSLDTFDRRPLPRYGDKERDEWRPPANVPIPLPLRERRRSPSRRVFKEDYEEIRYRDVEPREEYREVEVRREKSTRRRSPSEKSTRRRSPSVTSRAGRSRRGAPSARSSSESFEEVSPVREVGKKGKTRMPKRLVKKQVIIELGYPFEEEDDFIIVRRALEKDQIDEIIKISENYKQGEVERTTYVFEDSNSHAHEPPPPAPLPSMHHPRPQSVRSQSPSRHGHEVFEERIEESNHIGGPLTVLVPEERRMTRSERDIKAEIRQLEAERHAYEREGDRFSEYEIVERRERPREVVRIEKDRRGRLALVKSTR
ncbi:hypothetical protein K432DRAFT_223311 [Lepidopterella palustris CBS 459.81]|uniref:DUF8035 domain-containing protein n=1 Tax=Lepidopterella palustris CBS 459.81 TaxID=1314670 RepID=A0A8E2DXZ3_9PEZI|nr:hypothetical protein K432DRAFT_223311 [Lepidopterella palustris CBS 459.81]